MRMVLKGRAAQHQQRPWPLRGGMPSWPKLDNHAGKMYHTSMTSEPLSMTSPCGRWLHPVRVDGNSNSPLQEQQIVLQLHWRASALLVLLRLSYSPPQRSCRPQCSVRRHPHSPPSAGFLSRPPELSDEADAAISHQTRLRWVGRGPEGMMNCAGVARAWNNGALPPKCRCLRPAVVPLRSSRQTLHHAIGLAWCAAPGSLHSWRAVLAVCAWRPRHDWWQEEWSAEDGTSPVLGRMHRFPRAPGSVCMKSRPADAATTMNRAHTHCAAQWHVHERDCCRAVAVPKRVRCEAWL
jgi:hypothetical protein